MKYQYKINLVLLLLIFIVFNSCKKENSNDGLTINKENKPPIANAGPDRLIILPTDSVLMDGSRSSDPDGSISSYLWTKISGPASFSIQNPANAITKIKTLIPGSYLFELRVTDNIGLSSKDTIQIIVKDSIQSNGQPANYNCYTENLNWSVAENGMMALLNPDAIAGTLDCSGFGAEGLIPYHYDVWIQYEGTSDWIHLDYVFRDAIYSTTENVFLSSVIYNEPTGNDGPVSVPVIYAKPDSGIDYTKRVNVINTL